MNKVHFNYADNGIEGLISAFSLDLDASIKETDAHLTGLTRFRINSGRLLILEEMKEMGLDEILTKLKSGSTLAKDEKEFIASKFISYENSEELEQAIRAFGLSNKATDENILKIEKYLDSKSDIVLSGVVKVLGAQSYWGLAGNYIDKLKGFLKKEDAFEWSETQIAAFSVLGEYLNNTSDAELFEFLLQMFVNELEEYRSDPDYFQKARLERMYHCLDFGIRGSAAELEYRVGRMEFPDNVDEEIMMDIVKLIGSKKEKV
jgi:hypothetical protein